MKTDTKLNNCIKKIKVLKRQYQLSAEQSRYVDKIVRQDLKLQMKAREKKIPNFLNEAELFILQKKII